MATSKHPQQQHIEKSHEERYRLLGAEIRRVRMERGMNQAELGIQLGMVRDGDRVPQVTISRYELGGTDLCPDQIYDIEEALKAPHGTLLAAAGFLSNTGTPAADPGTDLINAVLTSPALHPENRAMVLNIIESMIKSSTRLYQEEELARKRPTRPRRNN